MMARSWLVRLMFYFVYSERGWDVSGCFPAPISPYEALAGEMSPLGLTYLCIGNSHSYAVLLQVTHRPRQGRLNVCYFSRIVGERKLVTATIEDIPAS
jgi:hypothetical protein